MVIGSNIKCDENGFGNRQYEDPKMLEKISEDHTDQLLSGTWTTVETPAGDAATSPLMPAANAPDAGTHSQPAEEAPERISPLTSLSPSPPPSPPPEYLEPIMPASPRSEAGYEDTITLAPPPGVSIASSKPANVGLPVQVGNKISRAFSVCTDNEPQSYREAMTDSTKWQAAIKSELDSHIENGTWEAGELPPGTCEISSIWVFKTKVNANGLLHYKARLIIHVFEQ